MVRVFNDHVGIGRSPRLIGSWCMTLKWLWQLPTHCKHKRDGLTATGEGGIAGTFLLTDAKLRGSACRHLGPHELGEGFSGELQRRTAVHSPHTVHLPSGHC